MFFSLKRIPWKRYFLSFIPTRNIVRRTDRQEDMTYASKRRPARRRRVRSYIMPRKYVRSIYRQEDIILSGTIYRQEKPFGTFTAKKIFLVLCTDKKTSFDVKTVKKTTLLSDIWCVMRKRSIEHMRTLPISASAQTDLRATLSADSKWEYFIE